MVNSIYKSPKGFIDRKVSTKQAIGILAKSNIEIDEGEATIILEFLYLLAKLYSDPQGMDNNTGQSRYLVRTILLTN